jgi:hypothetical protein
MERQEDFRARFTNETKKTESKMAARENEEKCLSKMHWNFGGKSTIQIENFVRRPPHLDAELE